mmetsp:Transcript_5893/g.14634  ORF Transcript_5893/g.14634 Transcript_5893/m.14634 type:complete len:359 (+) Transcript_5893:121-1197(+)
MDSGETTQAAKSFLSCSWLRFLPMKISLLSLVSPAAHSSVKSPQKSMCTAWYTNFFFEWRTEITPFMRNMSVPWVTRIFWMKDWSFSKSQSPASRMPQLVTLSSCSCSPSVLRNSGSISCVFSRSKALMFSTESTATFDCSHRWIGAVLLIARRRFSTRSRSSLVTTSILFSSSRSAKATCSTASFSAPSAFSSSRCCSMCLASTRVTMPSRREKRRTSSSTKKVWATGAGSAMPVVSITIPSSFKVPASTRARSLLSTTMRSCLTVQQMQPFIISMISSSACNLVFLCSSASSMPTSPNSFSITASFLPWLAVKMWLSKVVFPEPRKPVRMVTGTRGSSISAMPLPMLGFRLRGVRF